MFLDIVELTQGTDVESIRHSLRQSLHQAGLDDEYVAKHLISIAVDGASVLTAKTLV